MGSLLKAELMNVSAQLADSIPQAPLPAGAVITDPAVQAAVQLRVKLFEEFYPYVLAAYQGNGKNPDGTPNAFVDPTAGGPLPGTPSTTGAALKPPT